MEDDGLPREGSSATMPPAVFLPGFLRQQTGLRWRAFHPLDVVTSHRVCLPRRTIVKVPPQPFQRQPGNNEHEEVDGSRAVMIKCKVFPFALNSGKLLPYKEFSSNSKNNQV